MIRIEMRDGMGNARWITADLVDVTEHGFGVAIVTPLKPKSAVMVRGKMDKLGKTGDSLKAAVRWCVEKPDGSFGAGLEFLDNPTASGGAQEASAADPIAPETLDYYEIMQLSPNADADTIARVYRLLAQRYHPDNAETGDNEMFVRLGEAFQCLCDPEKRARYDVHHGKAKRLRWKIFDQAATSTGSEGEKRKRKGILSVLYAQTLNNPEHAEMNIQLLEELLGCPREHLQAALWYLKGKNYIKRSDGGRYSITVAGFDEAEANLVSIGPNRRLTEAIRAS